MASALRALGVQPGDRVVTWLPNALEAVIAMLGATSIGAVYSSTSPDFGTHGVLDRFGQIEPVVLFAADSYLYGGKRFDCLERLDEIRAGLPTLAGDGRGRRRARGHRGMGRVPGATPRFTVHTASGSRSTTRGTCSIRRVRPASRSASCTARAACCSST